MKLAQPKMQNGAGLVDFQNVLHRDNLQQEPWVSLLCVWTCACRNGCAQVYVYMRFVFCWQDYEQVRT